MPPGPPRSVIVLLAGYSFALVTIGALIEPGIAADYLRVALLGVAVVVILWIVSIAHRHRSDPGARMPNSLVWGMGITVAAQVVYLMVDVWSRIGEALTPATAMLAFLMAVTGAWLWRFEQIYSAK